MYCDFVSKTDYYYMGETGKELIFGDRIEDTKEFEKLCA